MHTFLTECATLNTSRGCRNRERTEASKAQDYIHLNYKFLSVVKTYGSSLIPIGNSPPDPRVLGDNLKS